MYSSFATFLHRYVLSSSRKDDRIAAHSFWIISRSSAWVLAVRMVRINSRSLMGAGILRPVPAAEEAAAAGARHSKWRRRGRSTDTAGGGIRAPARSPQPPGHCRPQDRSAAAAEASAGTARARRGAGAGGAGVAARTTFPGGSTRYTGLASADRSAPWQSVMTSRAGRPSPQRAAVVGPGGTRRPLPGFRVPPPGAAPAERALRMRAQRRALLAPRARPGGAEQSGWCGKRP